MVVMEVPLDEDRAALMAVLEAMFISSWTRAVLISSWVSLGMFEEASAEELELMVSQVKLEKAVKVGWAGSGTKLLATSTTALTVASGPPTMFRPLL
jgi:hypothetical protein